jgi:hypothetical protein
METNQKGEKMKKISSVLYLFPKKGDAYRFSKENLKPRKALKDIKISKKAYSYLFTMR